jgi:hypothetical protein
MEMRLWKSWNPLVNTISGLEAHWNDSATEHRIISIAYYAEESYHTGLLPPNHRIIIRCNKPQEKFEEKILEQKRIFKEKETHKNEKQKAIFRSGSDTASGSRPVADTGPCRSGCLHGRGEQGVGDADHRKERL